MESLIKFYMSINMINKKGQFGLIVGLLMAFLVVSMLVALLPAFRDTITSATSYATGLNCKGASDYNAAVAANLTGTSTTACMALTLFIPFLVLAVLIGLISKMLYDRGGAPAPAYYGQ